MAINLSNFLISKKDRSKMADFQDLDHIDGLSISVTSANLYNTNSFRNLRNGVSLGMQGTTSGTVSILGDGLSNLLIERTFPPATGSISISPVTFNLVTSITFSTAETIATISSNPALSISITSAVKEPSIKDITPQLIVIDSTPFTIILPGALVFVNLGSSIFTGSG